MQSMHIGPKKEIIGREIYESEAKLASSVKEMN